jgi:hypothetical protein
MIFYLINDLLINASNLYLPSVEVFLEYFKIILPTIMTKLNELINSNSLGKMSKNNLKIYMNSIIQLWSPKVFEENFI